MLLDLQKLSNLPLGTLIKPPPITLQKFPEGAKQKFITLPSPRADDAVIVSVDTVSSYEGAAIQPAAGFTGSSRFAPEASLLRQRRTGAGPQPMALLFGEQAKRQDARRQEQERENQPGRPG